MLHTELLEDCRGLAPEIMQGVIGYYNTAPPTSGAFDSLYFTAYFLPHMTLYKQIYLNN